MTDKYDLVGHPPETSGDSTSPAAATPDPGRIVLLECHLEQLRSALSEARSDADRARSRLAEVSAREAEHARHIARLHEEVAEAREEAAGLHRRLEHSEALRAELAGNLFGAATSSDVEELVRLRRESAAERERALVNERTVAELRSRLEELIASRETVLTRVAEWQRSVGTVDDDGLDLAEFISALRRDILDLEHRHAQSERREAELRVRLEAALAARALESSRAASGPPSSPSAPLPSVAAPVSTSPIDELVTALAAAETMDVQASLLGRLGRSGHLDAFEAIRPWATAADPLVRAAAYEALGRLLDRDPARLEPHVRWGLADGDPRVRRRVALAAATARGLALRPILEPLLGDPDPQVRRVVQEVLRRAPHSPGEPAHRSIDEANPVATALPAGVGR
jgi:hypothetical protein